MMKKGRKENPANIFNPVLTCIVKHIYILKSFMYHFKFILAYFRLEKEKRGPGVFFNYCAYLDMEKNILYNNCNLYIQL